MEKVRSNEYVEQWDVLYFSHPFCSGSCPHCWSSETSLGQIVPLTWHKNFWDLVDYKKIREVRLTGGEPFESKSFYHIFDAAWSALKGQKPLKIFTSGRPILSLKQGKEGIIETVDILKSYARENVEIHLSCDEFHAKALYDYVFKINKPLDISSNQKQISESLMIRMVKNFMQACDILVKETKGKFGGGKLKIHTATGRGDYHRNVMYSWLSDEEWDKKVIFSEGLIRAGRANEHPNSFVVKPIPFKSLFIIPGAEFATNPSGSFSQEYSIPDSTSKIYLNPTNVLDSQGAHLLGFWNVINKVFEGGTAIEALKYIGIET